MVHFVRSLHIWYVFVKIFVGYLCLYFYPSIYVKGHIKHDYPGADIWENESLMMCIDRMS